jgi:hypothetical protein
VWINAKRNSENVWVAYENGIERWMREYFRLPWVSKESQMAGECLSLTNSGGVFRASGKDCESLAPFVCYYTKEVQK